MNIEKEQRAIQYLKSFEPETEPYYLCYSGGKDSDCIRILARLAGVKFEAVHNLTTADAPETVQYIKSQQDIRIDKARWKDGSHKTMWNLIPHKAIPPTRLIRYCCSELKEQGGKYRIKVTGVRWAESSKRAESAGIVRVIGKSQTMKKAASDMGIKYRQNQQNGLILNDDNDESRRFVEQCYRTTSTMVNQIVDWTDNDVWEFLKHYGCKSNPLYECGFKRIGCIGCPMAGKSRYAEFERYPKYKLNYIMVFDHMLKVREERGLTNNLDWQSGKDVFRWWLGENPRQMKFEDLGDD